MGVHTTEASVVGTARRLAREAHAGQEYGPGIPYERHLADVAGIVAAWTGDADTVCAAWLHDAVEDTPMALTAIAEALGPEVAAIVGAVTDEPGRNRREREAKTLPKIRADKRAVLVKLADRLANIRAAHARRPDLLRMYRQEHAAFRAALHRPGEYEALWRELDRLSVDGG